MASEMPIDQGTASFHGQSTLAGEAAGARGKERVQSAHFEESLIDLVQIGMKYSGGSLSQFVAGVPRMTELLRSEFNAQLVKEGVISELWVQIVERLYAQLDYEQGHLAGCGSLTADRMQYFLLTLLLNEIRPDNWMHIPEIVQKQSWSLLTNMRHVCGLVTLRDFKTYLLLEGVRSQTDIQVLYEHFEIILKTYKRLQKKKTSQHSRAESLT